MAYRVSNYLFKSFKDERMSKFILENGYAFKELDAGIVKYCGDVFYKIHTICDDKWNELRKRGMVDGSSSFNLSNFQGLFSDDIMRFLDNSSINLLFKNYYNVNLYTFKMFTKKIKDILSPVNDSMTGDLSEGIGYMINVFGTPKIGSKGKCDLINDLNTIGVIRNDVHNIDVLDLDSLVCVGIYGSALVIDIHEVLLRRITHILESDRNDHVTAMDRSNELDLLLRSISTVIINKIISWFIYELYNIEDLDILFPGLKNTGGLSSIQLHSPVMEYHRFWDLNKFIWQVFYIDVYRSVNRIEDHSFGFKSGSMARCLLRGVKTTLTQSPSLYQGIDISVEMIKNYDVELKFKRFPFLVLDKFREEYRNAKNKAIYRGSEKITIGSTIDNLVSDNHYMCHERSVNGGKVYNGLDQILYNDRYSELGASIEDNYVSKVSSSVESITLSSVDEIVKSIKLKNRLKEEYNKDRLGLTLIGNESATAAQLRTLNKMDRATLLVKLGDKQRRRFISLENEIARLYADMNNCRSKDNQKSILRRSASIGKQIDNEMRFHKNDDTFKLALSLLDTVRSELDMSVANRDFYKEKMTYLYGQTTASKYFDY